MAAKEQWDQVVQLVANSQAWEWKLSTTTTTTIANNNTNTAATEQDVSTTTATTTNLTTPLHLACQYRAPASVLDPVIHILQRRHMAVPQQVQDEQGQTPLHIAVTAGCEEAVVQRLLAGDGLLMPAVLRDRQDRTPLHCATQTTVTKQRKKSFLGPNQLSLDTWHKRRVSAVLLEQYLEAALLQDQAGNTPIDYARDNKFLRHAMHKLQHTADMMWRPACCRGGGWCRQ